jgi:hypothetical protein
MRSKIGGTAKLCVSTRAILGFGFNPNDSLDYQLMIELSIGSSGNRTRPASPFEGVGVPVESFVNRQIVVHTQKHQARFPSTMFHRLEVVE